MESDLAMSSADLPVPETRYARSGDVSVAYQVMGEGPVDLVLVPGLVAHIEFFHELPGYTDFLRRLARFARVITFDKRGQGLSDRVAGAPTLDERMDDVRAVMGAAGVRRAVLFGFSEGGSMSALFAATFPERVSHLILCGAFARFTNAPDFDLMFPADATMRSADYWGTGASIKMFAHSVRDDAELTRLWAKGERLCASPGAYRALLTVNGEIDVRSILPDVRVPTLVLHRTTDRAVPVANGRYLAAHIPGARMIEYPDGDHAPFTGDGMETLCGDVEEFVTGQRAAAAAADVERVLATVLFTDIVDSTRRQAEIGDKAWRRVLDDHEALARRLVGSHRGRLVKTTGDGILASFDGPGRAILCATAFAAAAAKAGVMVRAGLHTGEIETRGDDISGTAVNAAARIMAEAGPGEVLVSRVVTDLVAGSGVRFAPRGERVLKGLPGDWSLFAAGA